LQYGPYLRKLDDSCKSNDTKRKKTVHNVNLKKQI